MIAFYQQADNFTSKLASLLGASRLLFAFFSIACFEKTKVFFEICESLFDQYQEICLISLSLNSSVCLICHIFVSPPKFLSFTCIPVCLPNSPLSNSSIRQILNLFISPRNFLFG